MDIEIYESSYNAAIVTLKNRVNALERYINVYKDEVSEEYLDDKLRDVLQMKNAILTLIRCTLIDIDKDEIFKSVQRKKTLNVNGEVTINSDNSIEKLHAELEKSIKILEKLLKEYNCNLEK